MNRFAPAFRLTQFCTNHYEVAEKANDEGTNALMSDLISGHEKTVWMLNATLE
jgi:DNA-binding ferritin-like protein